MRKNIPMSIGCGIVLAVMLTLMAVPLLAILARAWL